MTRVARASVLIPLLVLSLGAADTPSISNGWRGNGTGLWPEARPPMAWSRIPKGVLEDLRARADKPGDKAATENDPNLPMGMVRDWLVVGPFPVTDSVQEFNKAQLANEDGVQPAEGEKVGNLAWKKFVGTVDDPLRFASVDVPSTDVAPAVGGYKRNQVAYLHTYLFSPKGWPARGVFEHYQGGGKVLFNGKEVYSSTECGGLGMYYYPLSKVELGTTAISFSPHFDLEFRPGWNRLLLKVSSGNKEGLTLQRFMLRLMDPPTVPYETKNILWMTDVKHRSNATPIVVGDKVFVMTEPDELLCIDKVTGKILWTAANNYYEALSPAERQANPDFQNKVDPLVAQLKKEADFIKRQTLRNRIQKTLTEIDFKRFAWYADGHADAHFAITGFTSPSPVSDGKHVWVWCTNSVAACYDLDGKRQWITRVPTKELNYGSSPALADGTLAVALNFVGLIGLDSRTGQVRWKQPKVNRNVGAVQAARIAGVTVFVGQRGHVVRASDGKVLHMEVNPSQDSGWAPPTILGDVVYQLLYGVNHLFILDFTGATGDEWKPKRQDIGIPRGLLPNGQKGGDRWTAGSPLVVDDLAYLIDIYATLYVVDLKAKKFLYSRDTGLRGWFTYNAVPVAASATLVGQHVVLQNNQGESLVIQHGREFREVSRNRIATQMDRIWPVPAQETTGYSPPVPDGKRMYIRGERYLYCIGEK